MIKDIDQSTSGVNVCNLNVCASAGLNERYRKAIEVSERVNRVVAENDALLVSGVLNASSDYKRAIAAATWLLQDDKVRLVVCLHGYQVN